MAQRKVTNIALGGATALALLVVTALAIGWRDDVRSLRRASVQREQSCQTHLVYALDGLRAWADEARKRPAPCERGLGATTAYDTVGWAMKACYHAHSDAYREYFTAAMIADDAGHARRLLDGLRQAMASASFQQVAFPDLGPLPVPHGTCSYF